MTEKKDKPAEPNSLHAVLSSVFRVGPEGFGEQLTRFTQQLLVCKATYLCLLDAEGNVQVRSAVPEGQPGEEELSEVPRFLSADPAQPVSLVGMSFFARVYLESGHIGVLIARLATPQRSMLALAHERLTLISYLTERSFAESDITQLSRITQQLAQSSGQNRKDILQLIADELASLTRASYAAVGWHHGGRIEDLSVSGQSELGTRSALAEGLRADMCKTAELQMSTGDKAFGARAGSDDGYVFHVVEGKRHAGLLPFIAATAASLAPAPKRRRFVAKRFAVRALALLGIAAIGFIPVPDGVDVSATVAATSQRLVTSPINAPLLDVFVEENQPVTVGDPLAKMDTRELDLDLIALQADSAKALLERETARASRNASELRNAELTYERLEAKIASLNEQRENAFLRAPISGVVVAQGLADKKGAFLRQGDRILTVADLNGLRLDLSISPRDVLRVQKGGRGVFRPDFDPNLRLDAEVELVSPAVASGERLPTLMGRASLMQENDALRLGMKGVLAVEREYRPIWQIVWTRLRDWVLLRVWI